MGHAAAQQDGPFVNETIEDLRWSESSARFAEPGTAEVERKEQLWLFNIMKVWVAARRALPASA
jgi:hypothetical protein